MTQGAPPATPLRILEIGDDTLFARAVPEQTTFYWAAPKPREWAHRVFGPVRLIRSLLDLRAGKFDLVVVHAAHYAPWHPRSILTALRDWNIRAPIGLFSMFAWRMTHLFHDTPIAAVDFRDGFGIGRHNFFLLETGKAFFKRELPSDNWQVFFKSGHRDLPGARWRKKAASRRWVAKLKPISYGSFSSPPDDIAAEKTADIFFSGAVEPNSTARIAGLREVKKLEREGYVVDIPTERLSRDAFLRRMSGAWLAWSPAGLGWDCSRHYEAAMVKTVPLMNYPTIVRDRPFRDGEHCVLYAVEPGGLAQAARAALADKPRLQRMGEAARAHYFQHHTWRARAEHVAIEILGRRLDGAPVEPPPTTEA